MTFVVKEVTEQDKRDRQVGIHYTSGPVIINITEHVGHLRSFWAQLGRALDEVESA
jgi:hypothetical protein